MDAGEEVTVVNEPGTGDEMDDRMLEPGSGELVKDEVNVLVRRRAILIED